MRGGQGGVEVVGDLEQSPERPELARRRRGPTRRRLLADGEWRPTAEPTVPGEIGFAVSGLLSPFRTLAEITASFLTANQAGPMRLKEFITATLGQPWRDPAARLEESELLSRAEDY